MGGDAILHHPGNSTHVDYTNKACWTWYDIRTWSATNDVYKVRACNYRRRCLSNRFCVMRQFWPFRVDSLISITALRQAEDIFDYSGALLPPDNATFHLVWLLEESSGITVESTFVSSIQLRICFALMLVGIDHATWRPGTFW